MAADYAVCVFDASGRRTFRDVVHRIQGHALAHADDLRNIDRQVVDLLELEGGKPCQRGGRRRDRRLAPATRSARRRVIVSSGDRD